MNGVSQTPQTLHTPHTFHLITFDRLTELYWGECWNCGSFFVVGLNEVQPNINQAFVGFRASTQPT